MTRKAHGGRGMERKTMKRKTTLHPQRILWIAVALLWVGTGMEVRSQGETADRTREMAEQGDAEAQFNLGVMSEKGEGVGQDYKEAVKWYRKAAEQGEGRAQYNLALAYYRGRGVAQDFHEAVKWVRKAAQQGIAKAQYGLGVAYYQGEGVGQDYRKARKWLQKAAEQGLTRAPSLLGLMYDQGEGVPQDYVKAHAWFNLAAAQGDSEAAEQRDCLAARMTPAQIAEAQALAAELFERIESSQAQ